MCGRWGSMRVQARGWPKLSRKIQGVIRTAAKAHMCFSKRDFACRANRSCLAVQPRLRKYIPSGLPQIKSITRAIPAHQEGRFAIVTDVGLGRRWTLMCCGRTARDADGEVVWF